MQVLVSTQYAILCVITNKLSFLTSDALDLCLNFLVAASLILRREVMVLTCSLFTNGPFFLTKSSRLSSPLFQSYFSSLCLCYTEHAQLSGPVYKTSRVITGCRKYRINKRPEGCSNIKILQCRQSTRLRAVSFFS